MADFITMTCKSCGGKLQITPEINDFACMYCGTEFKVKREGGIVALAPFEEDIKKVSISTDKTASELALVRLKEEIEETKYKLDQERLPFDKVHKEKEEEILLLKSMGSSRQIVTVGISFVVILILLITLLTQILNLSEIWTLMISLIITLIISYIIIKSNPNDFYNIEKINDIEIELNQQKKEIQKLVTETNIRIKKLEEERNRHGMIVRGEM